MGKGPLWSQEETSFLIKCIEKGMSDSQISSEFHIKTKFENAKGFHRRTIAAISRRRRHLEMQPEPVKEGKPANHHKVWSREDDDRLLSYIDQGAEIKELALTFHRTESAIESRLQVLKSQKSFISIIMDWISDFGMAVNKLLFGSNERGK